MAVISHFNIESDFTVFFLFLTILFITLGVLLSRVAPKRRGGGRGQRFDDTIVDRNRELID